MIKTMVSSSSTNIFITIFIQLFQNRRTAYYHYKYFEQSQVPLLHPAQFTFYADACIIASLQFPGLNALADSVDGVAILTCHGRSEPQHQLTHTRRLYTAQTCMQQLSSLIEILLCQRLLICVKLHRNSVWIVETYFFHWGCMNQHCTANTYVLDTNIMYKPTTFRIDEYLIVRKQSFAASECLKE